MRKNKKISLKILNIVLFLFAGYLLFRVWAIPADTVVDLVLQVIVGALVLVFMLAFADNFLPPKKKKNERRKNK